MHHRLRPYGFFLTAILMLSLVGSAKGTGRDTLTDAELASIQIAHRNSSSGRYFAADSFSRRRDSVNASTAFLQVDPYYLMWSFDDPPSPDTILSRFYLSRAAKAAYRIRYAAAYESKSERYKTFQAMHHEDQELRWMMERCQDSLTCATLRRRLTVADTTHFNQLYQYVQKNGWPAVADGSLYASPLAIHDHARHSFYLPYIKQAVLAGQLPAQPLVLILHWLSQSKTNEAYRHMLDTSTKFSFDVSSILDLRLPSSLERIQQVVKKHCPVELYLMYEDREQSSHDSWVAKTNYPYKRDHAIQKLFDALQPECPKNLHEDVSALRYLPALRSKPRIMLYVVYK